MRFNRFIALIAGCLLAAAGASLAARQQSLADVAKKEEDRRKAAPATGKVYTNKDLKPVPTVGSPAGDPSVLTGGTEKDGDKPAEDKATADGDKAAAGDKADKPADAKPAEAGAAKDQKYWKDRIDAANLALDRDMGYAEAMQTRINALTTDFVNRDDPAQRSVIEQNRNRALAELDRLKKQIEDDKKTISDIEEEARRAGVPPGWLR